MDPETKEVVTRLENKVDGIIQALDRLTRIEERHIAFNKTLDRHEKWLGNHDERLRNAEGKAMTQGAGVVHNSKLVWTVIGAIGVALGVLIKTYGV